MELELSHGYDLRKGQGQPCNCKTASGASSDSAAVMNVLAYVHLRNIHGSTGAGRVARQLTEQLALRRDLSLHILADQDDHRRILPLVGEPWTNFDYHLFSSDTSRQQARWFATGGPMAESFWPKADIVYCTAESYVPVKKARLVVTAHDAAYFEKGAHRRQTSFWKQRLKWKILFRKLSSRVDMIHTVSQFSAERLSHFFPALASRIRVVPNAVTEEFFEEVHPAGDQYLLQQELIGRPFILVPGGLHFRKNAQLILTAAPILLKQYPKLQLVIAGHSNVEYSTRLGAIDSRIKFTGFVTDCELHALYSKALAVWFPSQYEGFGLPVLESMASGTPVVASKASSIPEVSGDAALLADPHDAHEHLDLLFALIEDQSLRSRFSNLGRAHSATFTWANSALRLKQYFEEIL